MALVVSDGLKAVAVSHEGSMPIARLDIFPVAGVASEAKGLRRRIYDGFVTSDENLLWTGSATPLLAYNWGQSPPLGISPQQLSDNHTWGMHWDGYFKCTRPSDFTGGITYNFGWVSAGYVDFLADGAVKGTGASPHSINESSYAPFINSGEPWLPFDIFYLRLDAAGANRYLRDERFVFFWKDSIDDEWKIMGSDVTCPPGGRHTNLVNTPVVSVFASNFIGY